MPELPEVETIAQRLSAVLPHKQILAVTVMHPKSFQGNTSLAAGATITGVSRRSKILTLSLDTGNSLLVHLKMTGQLIYLDEKTRVGGGHPTADWTATLPSTHTRVSLQLSDNAWLHFNDQRIFGWMKLVADQDIAREFANLGPDVIDEAATAEYFFEKIKKRRVPIKQLLMDNAIVAGVGNIYANDALHLAKVHPTRPGNTLSFAEAAAVLLSAQSVITLGIRLGGATMEHFRHIDGFSGQYQTQVRTYGKDGTPCPVCGTLIEKSTLGGRGTFFCPSCQV